MGNELDSTIKAIDLYEQYKHLFSEEAQKALANRWDTLERKRYLLTDPPSNVYTIEKILTLGVLAKSSGDIPDIAEAVANVINRYVATGHIIGCLQTLFKMDLAISTTLTLPFVICIYPALTQEGFELLTKDPLPEISRYEILNFATPSIP
jgi:hypothetical protein